MASKSRQESFVDMFSRLGRELNLPKVEVDRIIEHNRKNFEALEQSARTASRGATTAALRQREMVQEALDELASLARDQRPPSSGRELVSMQADMARKFFDMAIRNTTEMADIFGKSGGDSLEILRKRMRDGMQEIRDSLERRS